MYSQNDEEAFILKTFGSFVGRFLDIGAFDNVTFSNTRKLQQIGWSGVLVEPDPFNLCSLINNTGCTEKVKVVFAAVSPCDSLVPIHIERMAGRGWATTICAADVQAGNVREECRLSCWIPTVTPEMLYRQGPFDFINLDAEWMDFDILMAMPVPMLHNCKLICVEPRNSDERAMMKAWFHKSTGFTVGHETPENLLMVKN